MTAERDGGQDWHAQQGESQKETQSEEGELGRKMRGRQAEAWWRSGVGKDGRGSKGGKTGRSIRVKRKQGDAEDEIK